MFKLLFAILLMALVSYLAVWLEKHEGKLIIEWFEWEITTSPAFFIFFLVTCCFILYLSLTFIIKIIRIPIIIKKKIINTRIKKSSNALYNGIIASSYGNTVAVNKNLILAKKNLKKSSLLTFLDLQNSILKKNEKNTFLILSNMLKDPLLKPLAIKGLISYANKNKDIELFSNMLNNSLDKSINISWIIQDALNFCIKNKNWKYLGVFIEKKIASSDKKYKHMLSLINFKIANDLYLNNDNEKANLYLEKSLTINKYFPAFIELYCKLKKTKNKNQLLRLLKKYWRNYPHPNIENCINIGFETLSELSKVKEASKILIAHDNLYYKHLILGKLKFKAKIWGDSKKAFKESLKLKATKTAYYYLYQIKKKFSNDIVNITKLKKLYTQSKDETNFICNSCKTEFVKWDIVCNNCNAFDSLRLSTEDISKEGNTNKVPSFLMDSIKIN